MNYGGSAFITDSYFADNTSGYEGGAISVGTVTRGRVELLLTNSTLANNRANHSGGGIDIDSLAVVEVVNTTISGNYARLGDGIAVTGRVDLLNTTITGNQASRGGAVDVTDSWRVGAATARNSIIHGGIRGEVRFTDLGHNLIGVDPHLDPLADNGGPTPTHALLPNSPAIDAGDNTDAPATDQRGIARITDGDGDGEATIDIGAFEAPKIRVLTVNSERDAVDQNPGNGVVDTDVEGEITLRAAIMEANTFSEHTRIHLPEGTYPLSRNGDGADDPVGDLDVRSDIEIVGVGADRSVVDASASDAGFEVHDLAFLSLEGITVRGARHNGGIVNMATYSCRTATYSTTTLGHGLVVASQISVVTRRFARRILPSTSREQPEKVVGFTPVAVTLSSKAAHCIKTHRAPVVRAEVFTLMAAKPTFLSPRSPKIHPVPAGRVVAFMSRRVLSPFTPVRSIKMRQRREESAAVYLTSAAASL